MTVCIPEKGIYLMIPGFFPCRADDLKFKMAALAQHIENIEQLQARHRQQKRGLANG